MWILGREKIRINSYKTLSINHPGGARKNGNEGGVQKLRRLKSIHGKAEVTFKPGHELLGLAFNLQVQLTS